MPALGLRLFVLSDGCRVRKPLAFDFYLPDLNTIMEYQEIQHYEAWDKWVGRAVTEYIQR
jgi:hypothetical protein